MKTYNITKRLSKEARAAIENTIATHKKYKSAYFFSPASNAGTRRQNEKRFAAQNPDYKLQSGENFIEVFAEYRESCNNVYYSLTIRVDGEIKDIRALKKLLK